MKATRLLLFLAILSPAASAAPIPISAGNLVYTQNFNALAVATNNDTAATTWADDSTIPGWWLYIAGNTANTPTGLAGPAFTYYVSDGSAPPNTLPLVHGFYSLGASGNTDRAMGECPTTPLGELSAIAIFQNTTAGPLKLARMKFTAEAYRTNATANNRDSLFVWWKTAATANALTTNTVATTASNTTVFAVGTTTTGPTSYYVSGWTHLPEFNYTNVTATAADPRPPDTQSFDAPPSSSLVLIPAGEFLAIRWSDINDGGTDAMLGIDDLELTFEVAAPPVVQAVTAGNSPRITFTPSANSAVSYTPPANDQSELGWSGGTGASNVQTQPDSGAFVGTAKYFRINGPDTTFTTNAVNVSALAGQILEGRIELGFYSTSATGFEALDVLNARLEVAVDGDFTNTSPVNLITENFIDEPGLDTDQFDETIPVATPYINLGSAGPPPVPYPAADFVFHPFVKTIPIPAGATGARARIIFASGVGVSNTEHVLLDNVKFALAVVALDSDGDGISDAYEDANGLDKNSNTDRNTDLDGDGQMNYEEFLAGTAANNPNSTLRITYGALSTAREISLTWASVPGIRYQGEISTDLGAAIPWAPLGGAITATGTSTSVPPGIIIPAGNPRYFIRIKVVP